MLLQHINRKVPSLVDYVVDEETAILYEPGNVDDLKHKMERIIDDKPFFVESRFVRDISIATNAGSPVLNTDTSVRFRRG